MLKDVLEKWTKSDSELEEHLDGQRFWDLHTAILAYIGQQGFMTREGGGLPTDKDRKVLIKMGGNNKITEIEKWIEKERSGE